jgi:hypothetical protein
MKVVLQHISVLFLFTFFQLSCAETPVPVQKEYFVPEYSMNNLPVSDLYEGPADLGLISNEQMNELSGLAVSRQNPALMWTHNDSGDENRIFLMRNNGSWANTFFLSNIVNRDWEDIAIGPGPEEGVNYIYVADIGDNLAQYPLKYIYRFPEPDVNITLHNTPVRNVETIRFIFPDDVIMDAETLMIDPWTKDIYIVTKREYPVTVYRLPYPQSTTDTIVAEKYGVLPFTMAVGGDISMDGREIIIKSYDQVFLWKRNPGETMKQAFMNKPFRLSYVAEPQGESIAFATDGSGYYTVSEIRDGIPPKLYFYRRKN